MVSADNFSDGSVETRPALADTTNRLQKRPFSMISGDAPLKSGDGFRTDDAKDGDLHFAKQFCFGLDNSKCKSKLDLDRDGKVLSFRKDKQPCVRKSFGGGAVSSILPNNVSSDEYDHSGRPTDPTEKYLDRSLRVRKGNTRNVMVGSDIARDSCTSSHLMPASPRTSRENSFGFGERGRRDEGRLTAGVSQDRPTDDASENDDRDQGLVNLGSSKCGTMEWPTISGSQGSKFPGLERCAGLKGNGGETSTGDQDILKNCSCSFCSTAAYMWSDLHYQDIKGRLSALKKSQKEAGTLVKKISGAKDNAIQGQGNSAELSNLELSLMDQWRSLFAHMENTLGQESSHLESSFEKLKDLRESCKNDLEMIHKKRLGNS